MRPHILLLVYLVIAGSAIIYPGPRLLPSGTEPYVLGLPLPLGWTLCWVLATFVVLLLYSSATKAKD